MVNVVKDNVSMGGVRKKEQTENQGRFVIDMRIARTLQEHVASGRDICCQVVKLS